MTPRAFFFTLVFLVIMTEGILAKAGTCRCKFDPETMQDVIVENFCPRHQVTWTRRVSLPSTQKSITRVGCHCRCVPRYF